MNPPADVIVVGAGIVGAACAEALALAGVRVRVLEGARAAHGTSAAGMGHILVLDDSQAQLELTRLSRDLWEERAASWPASVEWSVPGTIWVAVDEEELEAVRPKHEWYGERGVATEMLDAAALRRYEPNLRPGLAGGMRIPGDSVVYPPAATRHMLERAVARGATVEERVPVARCGDGFVELAGGKRLEADVIVVAAGVATPTLVDYEPLRVWPKKGHLAITDRCQGFLRHQLLELGYLKSAHGHARTSVAFNVQPRATGQVLIGSSRQLDVDDPRVELEVLARMLARACEFMPGLAELPVVRTWVGFRPATDDNLPLIGPVPGRARLWVATGHEGVGITSSLGTGRILCDQLLGRKPPIDPAPFRLERLEKAVLHG